MVKHFLLHDRRTVFAIEDRNRNTPKTLTRNAPVFTIRNHVVHAYLTPFVVPDNLMINFIQQLVTNLIDGAEPLLHGAEDNLLLETVIVRITMGNRLNGKEAALLIHIMDNGLGTVFKEHALILAGILIHIADRVDGIDRIETVLAADIEVIETMAAGRMNDAGTILIFDVAAKQGRALFIKDDMMIGDALQFTALEGAQNTLICQMELGQQRIDKLCEHDEFALFGLHFGIFQIRIETDCFIGRNGPWRRCPDDIIVGAVQDAFAIGNLKSKINCRIGNVAINDLRIGDCRFIVRRPVDRLEALEDQSLQSHRLEGLDLTLLKFLVQRDIRVIVVTDLAEALLGCHLLRNLLVRIFFALLAELGGAQLLAVDAKLLNGVFNRQAMRIPARKIGCIVARHGMCTVDEVLDAAVHGRSCMQVAVGIRWTIMEDESLLSLVMGQDVLEIIILFPLL